MILSIAVCAFYSIWMDTKTFDDMMESKGDYAMNWFESFMCNYRFQTREESCKFLIIKDFNN